MTSRRKSLERFHFTTFNYPLFQGIVLSCPAVSCFILTIYFLYDDENDHNDGTQMIMAIIIMMKHSDYDVYDHFSHFLVSGLFVFYLDEVSSCTATASGVNFVFQMVFCYNFYGPMLSLLLQQKSLCEMPFLSVSNRAPKTIYTILSPNECNKFPDFI